MSKELEALETLFKDIEQCSIDLARADLDEYKLIEVALKEHEQYKAIEERLGIDLIKHLKLQLDGGYFKVPDRVVEEFCTSFKPNEIVGRIPDSVSPEGIRLTYYDKWDNTCEPIKYFYSWANEGKTWALTKEELEKK